MVRRLCSVSALQRQQLKNLSLGNRGREPNRANTITPRIIAPRITPTRSLVDKPSTRCLPLSARRIKPHCQTDHYRRLPTKKTPIYVGITSWSWHAPTSMTNIFTAFALELTALRISRLIGSRGRSFGNLRMMKMTFLEFGGCFGSSWIQKREQVCIDQ